MWYVVSLVCLLASVAVVIGVAAKKLCPGHVAVAVLLVLAAVGAALMPGRTSSRPEGSREYPQLERLGEHTAPYFAENARVLFLMNHPDERLFATWREDDPAMAWLGKPAATLQEWKERETAAAAAAFRAGAGRRIRVVDNIDPGFSVESFNRALAPYEDRGIDWIVSVTNGGLPVREPDVDADQDVVEVTMEYGLEDLYCFAWTRPPLFAVAGLRAGGDLYDRALLRGYMQDGFLTAVVFSSDPRDHGVAVSADNQEDMP